jgi:hypothetical protein
MFLRSTKRLKDGKEHRYWSIVENRRSHGKRVVQKQLLYLGEIKARTTVPKAVANSHCPPRVSLLFGASS